MSGYAETWIIGWKNGSVHITGGANWDECHPISECIPPQWVLWKPYNWRLPLPFNATRASMVQYGADWEHPDTAPSQACKIIKQNLDSWCRKQHIDVSFLYFQNDFIPQRTPENLCYRFLNPNVPQIVTSAEISQNYNQHIKVQSFKDIWIIFMSLSIVMLVITAVNFFIATLS